MMIFASGGKNPRTLPCQENIKTDETSTKWSIHTYSYVFRRAKDESAAKIVITSIQVQSNATNRHLLFKF